MTNFEHCTDYIKVDGAHISEGQVDKFKGNVAMASVNALHLRKLSRRDDLVSLTYMLIYMIEGHLVFMAQQYMPLKYHYNYIRVGKLHLTPEQLCMTPRAKLFINFVREIFNLSFEEQPNYEKLK